MMVRSPRMLRMIRHLRCLGPGARPRILRSLILLRILRMLAPGARPISIIDILEVLEV